MLFETLAEVALCAHADTAIYYTRGPVLLVKALNCKLVCNCV